MEKDKNERSVKPKSDECLMAQVASGEKEAFEELMIRYRDSVYGYVFKRVHEGHATEDIVQETFLHTYRSLKHNREKPVNFGAWIFGVARNCCKEHFRENRLFHPEIKEPMGKPSVDTLEALEQKEALKTAVMNLPEETRQILVLRHQKGITFDEIAQVLNKPIGTVMSSAARAYKRLRVELADFYGRANP